MLSRRNATPSSRPDLLAAARLAAGNAGNAHDRALLEQDELLALCHDEDATVTLLRYLLVTCRDASGLLRLRPVSQMPAAAQELFFSHFDPQRLVDLAGDESAGDEVRAAAAAVLDCCTTGGWRVSVHGSVTQVGTVAGMIIGDQIARGRHEAARRSMRLFARRSIDSLDTLAAAS